GERWVNLSYDYLFRFDPRSVTNKVVLILMDQEAHAKLHQDRRQPWDRGMHADLLKRLTADKCPLVVFDSFFGEAREAVKEQWLRYYGQNGAWTSLSYHQATNQAPNYFHDKFVFIGNKPETPLPDGEKDEYRTPYTRWTKEAVGGVEIMATEFLNLINGDWLRRPPSWFEALVLVGSGLLLGGGLCRARPLSACGLAVGAGFLVTFAAAAVSYF